MNSLLPTVTYSEIHRVMPIASVDIVIVMDGQYALVVDRETEPALGEVWFPGGRIMKGESIKTAALRHLFQDTGARVSEEWLEIIGADETMFDTDPFGHGAGSHTVNILVRAPFSKLDGQPKGHWFKRDELWHPYLRKWAA